MGKKTEGSIQPLCDRFIAEGFLIDFGQINTAADHFTKGCAAPVGDGVLVVTALFVVIFKNVTAENLLAVLLINDTFLKNNIFTEQLKNIDL